MVDYLSNPKKCIVDDCSNFTYYPDIGFNEALVYSELYEVLNLYVRKLNALYESYQADEMNDVDFSNLDKDNEAILLNTIKKINEDDNMRIITLIGDIVIEGLIKYTDMLGKSCIESFNGSMVDQILLFLLELFLFFCVGKGILSKMIKNKQIEIDELVDLVFTVPTSTINIVPKYRRFIETGVFDDE